MVARKRKHPWRRWCALLLLPWMLASFGALAQETTTVLDGDASLPQREEISQRLKPLTQEEKPGAAQEKEIEELRAALANLESLETLKQQRAELEKRFQQAPEEIRRLDNELREARRRAEPDKEDIGGLSSAELDTRISETLDSLRKQQDRLADTNARLVAAQTLPERVQTAISDTLTRIDEIRTKLNKQQDVQDSSDVWQLQTELAMEQGKLALERQKLAANTRLQELAKLRRDIQRLAIERLEKRLRLMQNALEEQRQQQLAENVDASAHLETSDSSSNPLIVQAGQDNQALSVELVKAIDRHNAFEWSNIELRSRLDRARQIQRVLNEQVDAVGDNQLLSRILREQRRALPNVTLVEDLSEKIADIRLRQFELERQREALSDIDPVVDRRIEEAGLEPSAELTETLAESYRSRRGLMNQLEQTYGELLATAVDLQLNQRQISDTVDTLNATIEERLFWLPNRAPLNLTWLKRLPASFLAQISGSKWHDDLDAVLTPPPLKALWGIPLLVLAAGLLLGRRAIRARLLKLHKQIGRLKRDTQMHTPWAILLNALIAAPGPLALAALGLGLKTGTGLAWGDALLQLALAWGAVALARRLTVSNGVAVHHFHWPVDYVLELRRLFGQLGLALIPVLLISALIKGEGLFLAERPLYFLPMLAGFIGMSLTLARLVLAHRPYFGIKLFHVLLGLALAAAPLVLGVMLVLGYEYTVLRLVERFITSLYAVGLWLLGTATVVRSLAVAARRLAYHRAKAQSEARAKESADAGGEVVEEPPLDLEQVNQQSLRLAKLLLFLGLTLVLYVIWSDLLVALAYFDHIKVWSTTQGIGETLSETPITLADILIALLVVVLTWSLARNLPGLLEVMVLSHLTLKPGGAYAISSLLSYTIVGVGIVAALGTLGVSWDKLQWLVAALGVGLGFGLQEIFANFISGLILLFERPIRIGDTITLGNLHGTITRIRIRATTMTDFDRKEIIIPNKTFVTEQLTNWSLSDNVTRVTLEYGVAHGSDLETVRYLLHQVAKENERVLDDPAPMVICSSYGPSAFNFHLYIYVNDLFDRYFAPDEINRQLDGLFREHGIRVAFDQMDVWLHDTQKPAKGESTDLSQDSSSSAAQPEERDEDEEQHQPPKGNKPLSRR